MMSPQRKIHKHTWAFLIGRLTAKLITSS